MYNTLKKLYPRDADLPARSYELQMLGRVLDGTMYDALTSPFHDEKSGAGEYIPLRNRAPSVRQNLCATVVHQSVGFLFGEGRFPTVYSDDLTTREALADLIRETDFARIMVDAAIKGSLGSVAVRLRVIDGELYFDALNSAFLTPKWDPRSPRTLASVTERYKVAGADLSAQGYDIPMDMLGADHWFVRSWDTMTEVWYLPQPISQQDQPLRIDQSRTVEHKLGFCPMVWVKNLPPNGDIDGNCTFRAAIETQIEIEYQLSQLGRGLKYSQDPILLIKEPTFSDGSLNRSASNAITVDADGDAKLIEINGAASAAVIEYCRHLREVALESIRGNRATPDKIAAGAMSGKAMELLHLDPISLADNLRTSYGDAILSLMKMVLRLSEGMSLTINGEKMPKLATNRKLSLRWPAWFPPTENDKNVQAQTQQMLAGAGLISKETAVTVIAPNYDIESVAAEMSRIKADEDAAEARAMAENAQVQVRTEMQA